MTGPSGRWRAAKPPAKQSHIESQHSTTTMVQRTTATATKKAQQTCFKGAIPKLQGHFYDLLGLHSMDLFMTTTRVVAVYVGCELCGDIWQSIETFALAILPRPI